MNDVEKEVSPAQEPSDNKKALPVLMTAQLMQLKIKVELTQNKLTLAALEDRAVKVVKNEDNLREMASILKDLDLIKDLAEQKHEIVKKPYWDAGKACDQGKKLVLTEVERIRGMIEPDFERLLADIAERSRVAEKEKREREAILKGIEDTVLAFSNMIVAAATRKALTDVQSRINLEKSPSRNKKYSQYHEMAKQRFDTVLLPIIEEQKEKLKKLEGLNQQLLEAEAHNDPERMDELTVSIDAISNEILQNHAKVQEEALNQEEFAVEEVTEVLPGFRVKRTNYSYEIVDEDLALKKSRELLTFSIDKKKARAVLEKLLVDKALEGKDEVTINGIRYIAKRKKELL